WRQGGKRHKQKKGKNKRKGDFRYSDADEMAFCNDSKPGRERRREQVDIWQILEEENVDR
ncbi:MAG: hypothetical protein JSW34_04980, partial [Candidatus Zixiibacteriota bacterium]